VLPGVGVDGLERVLPSGVRAGSPCDLYCCHVRRTHRNPRLVTGSTLPHRQWGTGDSPSRRPSPLQGEGGVTRQRAA